MTPRERRSALAILAMFLPSLAALAISARLGATIDRPAALRTFALGEQEHAAFFFADAVHVLDGEGRRVTRQALQELGLTQLPTDADITRAPDGKLQAWLFEDRKTPRVVRCDLAGTPPRLQGCATAIEGPQLKTDPRSLTNHLAVDLPRQRVFVADAKGGMVRMLDLQGKLLAKSEPGELFFPNRLRLVGDHLLVADNDNYRLTWLDASGASPTLRSERSLHSRSHPQGARRKVTDFVLAAGDSPQTLWLLGVQQGQKNGRILIFGPDLKPRGTANLGGFGDPLTIDRLGNHVLAADFNGIALYRVAADGSFLGEFGDAAMQAELRSARRQVKLAVILKYAGFAGLALTMLVGFFLAWRYGERRPPS